MQPGAYLGVDISPSLSLRVGGSKIKALRGGALNANVVDVALVFNFGVPEHGRH